MEYVTLKIFIQLHSYVGVCFDRNYVQVSMHTYPAPSTEFRGGILAAILVVSGSTIFAKHMDGAETHSKKHVLT